MSASLSTSQPIMNASNPPSRPTRPRRLTVVDTHVLSPHLRRVLLGGPDLHDFPESHAGAHIKLFIPSPGQALLLPRLGANGVEWPLGARPIARTYSLRGRDARRGTLSVDFVLHGNGGPASKWAAAARVGDAIGLAGPGGPALCRADAERHLFCGDLSALPAIAAVLERLPAQAKGLALIEVADAADELPLRHPSGIELRWFRRAPDADSPLPELVSNLRWDDIENTSATIAGESAAVASIRSQLLAKGLSRDRFYAVPYWRRGQREEDYHAERHRFMDEEA